MSDVRKSYEILEKIGKGTYGKVYKAKCKRKGSVVALKKIKFDKDEDGIPAAVIREVSILYEMQHPHIVKLLDQVIFDTKLFLVFEYSGVDLEKWMEQNKLSQSIIKVVSLMSCRFTIWCTGFHASIAFRVVSLPYAPHCS